MKYRAAHGIGGLMMWALDQDDDQLNLLKAVVAGVPGDRGGGSPRGSNYK